MTTDQLLLNITLFILVYGLPIVILICCALTYGISGGFVVLCMWAITFLVFDLSSFLWIVPIAATAIIAEAMLNGK